MVYTTPYLVSSPYKRSLPSPRAGRPLSGRSDAHKDQTTIMTVLHGAGRTGSPALAKPIAQLPSRKEMIYSGAQSQLSEIDLISSTSVLLGGVIPSPPSSTAQIRPGEQRPQRGELRHRGLYDNLGPEGVRPLCKASGRGFCGGQVRLHMARRALCYSVLIITSYRDAGLTGRTPNLYRNDCILPRMGRFWRDISHDIKVG